MPKGTGRKPVYHNAISKAYPGGPEAKAAYDRLWHVLPKDGVSRGGHAQAKIMLSPERNQEARLKKEREARQPVSSGNKSKERGLIERVLDWAETPPQVRKGDRERSRAEKRRQSLDAARHKFLSKPILTGK